MLYLMNRPSESTTVSFEREIQSVPVIQAAGSQRATDWIRLPNRFHLKNHLMRADFHSAREVRPSSTENDNKISKMCRKNDRVILVDRLFKLYKISTLPF
ncbi:hypothetical protein Tcan_10649 [Toxocara canis]|uniref:Uncharacterized protein n=1 Tax=Toxocara canis TaxID=6265 RepID=A0A0B2VJ89_TOXCA|nr:hypothetical protein Tcan_10649 [Toxocara canis]